MNNKNLLIFSLLVVIIAVIINRTKGPLFSLLGPSQTNFTTQLKGETFPLTLYDPSGIEYTLTSPPQRIISATLATDHMLSGLISQTRIVGVSLYVDYPSLSNIIGFYDSTIPRAKTEIESILSRQPDLVFVASYSNPEAVRYLLRSGIAVVRLSEFKSFNNIMDNLRLLATVTDSKAQGDKIIKDLQTRLHFIQQQVKGLSKPRVLYYDLNGYSVGGHSLMNESIEISGGINAAQGIIPDGDHKISEELAIALQPDVIIMNKWIFNQSSNTQNPAEILKNKKAWENVPAVINDRVYAVPDTWLHNISQYRIKGVEAMATLLHPSIMTYDEAKNAQ